MCLRSKHDKVRIISRKYHQHHQELVPARRLLQLLRRLLLQMWQPLQQRCLAREIQIMHLILTEEPVLNLVRIKKINFFV